MSAQRRNRLLGIWLTTLVLLVLLAGALSDLALLPARSFGIPGAAAEHADPELEIGWLFVIILGLYALVFIWVVRTTLRWRVLYAVLVLLLLIGSIAGLTWLLGDEEIGPPESAPIGTPVVEEPTPEWVEGPLEMELREESPAFMPPARWVRMVVTVSLGVFLAAVLMGAIWFLYLRREPPSAPNPLAQLAAQAQTALNALRDGADTGDVVLRCYFEMLRVLDQTQGIRRVEAVTPREFAVQLLALGLPAEPVQALTRLFEEVRYGSHEADDAVAERAVGSLEAIVAACEVLE